jgi:branched-chain amino acid aminotransferase
MKGGYFLLNGQFHKESDAIFGLADLAGRAEGFKEAFRAESNEILFQESVSRHLLATAETTETDLTGLIDSDGRLLRKDVSRLLNKNKLYLSARIEIQIYSVDHKINILLRTSEMERDFYPIQEPGVIVSFYHHHKLDISPVPSYFTTGLFVRQAAARMAKELNQPSMILLNREGNACESLHGSFAILNNKVVTFLSATSGGYRCAITEEVIQSVQMAGYHTVEKEKITPEELLEAEELFIFDACYGIRKVLGLEDSRYFSTKTQIIADKLSELARKDRAERVES